MVKRPHLTPQQKSDLLIEKAQGDPMTLQELADALGTTYGTARGVRAKLKKLGLPMPKLKRAKHNGFKDDAKMPPNTREQVSTHYPSKLQYMSWRYIEINGEIKIAYLLW